MNRVRAMVDPSDQAAAAMKTIEHADRTSVRAELKRIADGAEHYVAATAKLARLEVAGDVGKIGMGGVKIALCAFTIVLGYVLGCVALALALAPLLGVAWAFLAVSAANVLVGGAGLLVVARDLRSAFADIGARWRAQAAEIGGSVRRLKEEAFAPMAGDDEP